MDQIFDVAIIGGGINGCGCAADAALRGLSVVLLEQDDLASKTSSSSTKLIHGGLRYLEHYEFSLVKKALRERQRLLDLAPHLVHPQALVLPYEQHMRPSWFLRFGLFLYDHLSFKNRLPRSKSINRKKMASLFAPLKKELDHGFLFYDGAADDARLTLTNAIQAKNHGASIRTHSTVTKADTINSIWQLSVQPQQGASYTLYAKTLINAAGPWVKAVGQLTDTPEHHEISLVKGSHIVVPQLYDGDQAYFLQHHDKRVIFVIPYHGFSMIGTTDVPLQEKPEKVSISDEEINYLVDLVNEYFKTSISKNDIIYTWSGVRALLANESKKAQSLSRDYDYEFYLKPAPIVTIYGGKITTYRQLAEETINHLKAVFPDLKSSATATTPLPGATFEQMNFTQYIRYAKEKYHWMDAQLLQRYLYTYGSCMEQFMRLCPNETSLGKRYGDDLYQVEIDYLILEEWARSCDDILKRRTKLDLSMDAASKKELAHYLDSITSYPLPQTEPLLH
jgi:glycerol-3-phosphate dehydrogenase